MKNLNLSLNFDFVLFSTVTDLVSDTENPTIATINQIITSTISTTGISAESIEETNIHTLSEETNSQTSSTVTIPITTMETSTQQSIMSTASSTAEIG